MPCMCRALPTWHSSLGRNNLPQQLVATLRSKRLRDRFGGHYNHSDEGRRWGKFHDWIGQHWVCRNLESHPLPRCKAAKTCQSQAHTHVTCHMLEDIFQPFKSARFHGCFHFHVPAFDVAAIVFIEGSRGCFAPTNTIQCGIKLGATVTRAGTFRCCCVGDCLANREI